MGWQPSKPLPNKTTPREKPLLTNCKNCGAPLHGPVCEYCGTVYGDGRQMVMKINTAKLTFAHMPTITRR